MLIAGGPSQTIVKSQIENYVLSSHRRRSGFNALVAQKFLAIVHQAKVFAEKRIKHLAALEIFAPVVEVLPPPVNVLLVAVHRANRAQPRFQKRLSGIRAVRRRDPVRFIFCC